MDPNTQKPKDPSEELDIDGEVLDGHEVDPKKKRQQVTKFQKINLYYQRQENPLIYYYIY